MNVGPKRIGSHLMKTLDLEWRDERWMQKWVVKLRKREDTLVPVDREFLVLQYETMYGSMAKRVGVMWYLDGRVGVCNWEEGTLTFECGLVVRCDREYGKMSIHEVTDENDLMDQYRFARATYNASDKGKYAPGSKGKNPHKFKWEE